MGKMSDHVIGFIKCFPCEYKLFSFARPVCLLSFVGKCIRVCFRCRKRKETLLTGTDNHKTVMDSHSKCEPALNTEHKGDTEEGKLYNWLN